MIYDSLDSIVISLILCCLVSILLFWGLLNFIVKTILKIFIKDPLKTKRLWIWSIIISTGVFIFILFNGYSICVNPSTSYFKAKNVYADNPEMQKVARMIERGDLDGIKAWRKTGANIDTAGKCGVTPLYLAWFHNKLDIFDYLLSEGANLDIKLLIPRESSNNIFYVVFESFKKAKTEDSLLIGVYCYEDKNYMISALKHRSKPEEALHYLFDYPSYSRSRLNKNYSYFHEVEDSKLKYEKLQLIIPYVKDKQLFIEEGIGSLEEICLLSNLFTYSKCAKTLMELGVPISFDDPALIKKHGSSGFMLWFYDNLNFYADGYDQWLTTDEGKKWSRTCLREQYEDFFVYLKSIDPQIIEKIKTFNEMNDLDAQEMEKLTEDYNNTLKALNDIELANKHKQLKEEYDMAYKEIQSRHYKRIHDYFVEFDRKRGIHIESNSVSEITEESN